MASVIKRSTFRVWGDVIFALFIREIKSKFNDKLGISWSVLSPVLFILLLSLIRGRLDGGLTHNMPTFFFMVYGLLVVQLFLVTVGAASRAIIKNKSLFAFRQVKPVAAIIAVSFFELLNKVFVTMFIFVFAYFIELDIKISDPLLLLKVVLLVWLLAMSIGSIFAIFQQFIPELDKLRALAMRPLFFISGVFFSLQDIPVKQWKWFDWNPLLHAVELTRISAYSSYSDKGVSLMFLYLCCLGALFLSLSFYQVLWKQALSR